jgi:peptidoglycan/LPS O-acetylase OafA/YrhL
VPRLRRVRRLNERTAIERTEHFDFVDSLRGIAVLGVVLVHTGQRVGLPAAVAAVTDFGAYGVHLFFVASAFTLFSSMNQRSRAERRPTLNYFLRRLFRIAPPFWLAVLFYLWWYGTGPQYWAPRGIGWPAVLATIGFAHGWSPTTINSVVPGGWSIAVEMNFYLLVPVLFAYLTNLRRCVWFFMACLLGQAAINLAMQPVFLRLLAPDEQYLADLMRIMWLPTQLPVFAAGFVLYYSLIPHFALQTGDVGLASRARWLSLPILMPLLAVLALALLRLAPASTFWGTVFAILAGGLALHPLPILVNSFTRYVGNISYSGYLVHFVVLDLAERVIRHFTPIPGYPLPYLVTLYAAVVLGTILLATATSRLIEEPARAIGRSLIAGLERKDREPVLRLSS